ncbi:hypothetical protein NC651_006158 [Populus alba x Populus x berolinensis]|nr:hypothetical protein NC651_006158 [Populus alba x Populus x berolinensis]
MKKLGTFIMGRRGFPVTNHELLRNAVPVWQFCDFVYLHLFIILNRLQGVVVSAGSLLRIPIGAHSCRGDLDEINNCSSLYYADTRKLYVVEAENKEERR